MKELHCFQLPVRPGQLPLLGKGQNVLANRITNLSEGGFLVKKHCGGKLLKSLLVLAMQLPQGYR